eukprot:1345604-Prymnesium_polylepis.1
MLCTCSPRGSSLSQEAQSAPQRGKVGARLRQHPTLFHDHSSHPADPTRIPECNGDPRGG